MWQKRTNLGHALTCIVIYSLICCKRLPNGGALIRYALVGAGSRAGMFIRALTTDYADVAQLVALADTNPARPAVYKRRFDLDIPVYDAGDFTEMLKRERVDVVLVTTVDRYHEQYLV